MPPLLQINRVFKYFVMIVKISAHGPPTFQPAVEPMTTSTSTSILSIYIDMHRINSVMKGFILVILATVVIDVIMFPNPFKIHILAVFQSPTPAALRHSFQNGFPFSAFAPINHRGLKRYISSLVLANAENVIINNICFILLLIFKGLSDENINNHI